MSNMTTVEAKAFVPSKDFALSKRFYQDLGFDLAWSSEDLACFRQGNASSLLQNFYVSEHAANFMMHLLVEDVAAWWGHVQAQGLAAKYGVKVEPPADRPWGLRDFAIVDPTGVLWRIGQDSSEAADSVRSAPKTSRAVLLSGPTPVEHLVRLSQRLGSKCS